MLALPLIGSLWVPGVHTLLRKLQFLFELPARLTKCVELEAYGQAVRYYSKARSILHQYQHMPSFQGIQDDCQKIMADLAQKLREKFRYRPIDLIQCWGSGQRARRDRHIGLT